MDPSPGAASTTDPREENLRWRLLFDRLPASVAFWDRDQRNVMANQTYESWFGIAPQAMRGVHAREVFGERYADLAPHMETALAGVEETFEHSLVTPAGETKHLRVTYLPAQENGEVVGFYVLGADVTREHDTQRDLLEAQSLGQMGSYTFRPPVLECSPEFLRIVGRDPDGPSPTLEDYLTQVHPEDMPSVDAALERADRGQAYEASYRIIRPDGTVVHVHSRTHRSLDAFGNLQMLRGVMQDETRVQHLASGLERANELLKDLIGVLGHDLRQPIAVVRGYLDQLLESWQQFDEPERQRLIATAARVAGRMDGLLEDILTMVNLDAGTLTARPTAVRLGPLLRDQLEEATLEATLRVADDLAAHADPVHVRQIVANLISNAARYGQGPYELSATAVEGSVAVTLRDHGEGVPDEFVPHLFDRFSRASSGIATRVGGTGFGLYIVQRLALANAGSVAYTPVDPTGSAFTVTLPCA